MTNNKLKKFPNSEEVNNSPMKDLLIAAQSKDLLGMISSIVSMNEKEFEEIEPVFTERINQIFDSREYKNNISAQLNLMSDFDYVNEKKGYEEVKNSIKEIDFISENKRRFLDFIVDKAYDVILKYNIDPSEHIKVIYKKLHENAIVPTYAHIGDAGADLYALTDDHITVPSGDTMLIPTGIALKIPGGYEAQIRPRSGMSLKTKIRIANAPGTIDSNYRGEIQVIVDNQGKAPFIISKGDRIAQIVFNKVPTADFEEGEVETEEDNSRGEEGFGSSGTSEINV